MIEFLRSKADQFTDPFPYTLRDKKGISPSYFLLLSQMLSIQRLLKLCFDAIFNKNLICGSRQISLDTNSFHLIKFHSEETLRQFLNWNPSSLVLTLQGLIRSRIRLGVSRNGVCCDFVLNTVQK